MAATAMRGGMTEEQAQELRGQRRVEHRGELGPDPTDPLDARWLGLEPAVREKLLRLRGQATLLLHAARGLGDDLGRLRGALTNLERARAERVRDFANARQPLDVRDLDAREARMREELAALEALRADTHAKWTAAGRLAGRCEKELGIRSRVERTVRGGQHG